MEARGTGTRLTSSALGHGVRWLVARDSDLAGAYARTGVPPLWARRPGFSTLTRIILEQQVSLGSAQAMYRRLIARVERVTARAVAELGPGGLRALGFTRQKATYCHGLAERVANGSLDLRALGAMPDDLGRQALLDVPGLGPWSVDIYYLMALGRPDVWPRGDLALAVALRHVKRLPAVPSPVQQEQIASAWSPWRAVAARLLWKDYLAGNSRAPARSPAPAGVSLDR